MAVYLPSLNRVCGVGKPVNTPPFHGGITGSIPVRRTRDLEPQISLISLILLSQNFRLISFELNESWQSEVLQAS